MTDLSEYLLSPEEQDKVRSFIERLRNKEEMPFKECPLYDRCSAPICPMDPVAKLRIWYSNEDVCSRSNFKDNKVVVTQRKITKKGSEGYFTFEMLNRDIVVKKGIRGIDPDIPESIWRKGENAIESVYREREETWIKGHPEISAEQREKMKEEGLKRADALRRYREMI